MMTPAHVSALKHLSSPPPDINPENDLWNIAITQASKLIRDKSDRKRVLKLKTVNGAVSGIRGMSQ